MEAHSLLFARALVFLVSVLAIPSLVGAGSVPFAPVEAAATLTVRVVNFGYEDEASGGPMTEARVGDTVHFVWTSGVHSVTHGAAGRVRLGGFDSGVQSTPATFDLTLTSPGVIVYTCTLHANMNGVISVSA